MQRILLRRAPGIEVLRRRGCVVAVSDVGLWLELSAREHRALIETERPRTLASLQGLGFTVDDARRLYQARLLSFNGRLRPRVAPTATTPPAVLRLPPDPLDQLDLRHGEYDIALINLDASSDLTRLLPLMRRGACVVPVVGVERPKGFVEAFQRLAGGGFRLFRLEPVAVAGDDEARALAEGYLDMVRAALHYADTHPARFRISGLDGWLARLAGCETPFVAPHPRCARCTVRAFCRPDQVDGVGPLLPSCTWTRTILDGLLWMLLERPDLPALLTGPQIRRSVPLD